MRVNDESLRLMVQRGLADTLDLGRKIDNDACTVTVRDVRQLDADDGGRVWEIDFDVQEERAT